jgi:hypothetical protein
MAFHGSFTLRLRALVRSRAVADVAGDALSFRNRAAATHARAPEPRTDPDIQEAEPAVQEIEKLKRNAGASEQKPALAKEEREQRSIQDHDAKEGGR